MVCVSVTQTHTTQNCSDYVNIRKSAVRFLPLPYNGRNLLWHDLDICWCILFCSRPACCAAAPRLQISRLQTIMQPTVCTLKCSRSVVQGMQNPAHCLCNLQACLSFCSPFLARQLWSYHFWLLYRIYIQLFGYIPSHLICTSSRLPAYLIWAIFRNCNSK